MKKTPFLLLLFICLIISCQGRVDAKVTASSATNIEKKAQPTNLTDKVLISKAQFFLNCIESFVTEFVQINPNQTVFEGKIFIRRYPDKKKGESLEKGKPGKMRIDTNLVAAETLKGNLKGSLKKLHSIIAKNEEVTLYDFSDKSKSSADIDRTPAAFILQPTVNLFKNADVRKVIKAPDNSFFAVEVVRKGDLNGASITLYFSLYPSGDIKYLQQWVVKDDQGKKRQVKFKADTTKINDLKNFDNSVFKDVF